MRLYTVIAVRLMALVLLILLILFLADSSSCNALADCRDEEYNGDIHSEHEDAWVLDVNREERLVEIQTVESRVALVFRVDKDEDIRCFREGNIVAVTFGPKSQIFIRKRAREIVSIIAVDLGYGDEP